MTKHKNETFTPPARECSEPVTDPISGRTLEPLSEEVSAAFFDRYEPVLQKLTQQVSEDFAGNAVHANDAMLMICSHLIASAISISYDKGMPMSVNRVCYQIANLISTEGFYRGDQLVVPPDDMRVVLEPIPMDNGNSPIVQHAATGTVQ